MSSATLVSERLPSLPLHAFTSTHADLAHGQNHSPTSDIVKSASYTSLQQTTSSPDLKKNFSDRSLPIRDARQSPKVSSTVQNANIELFRRASEKTKARMTAGRFVSAQDAQDSRSKMAKDKSDAVSVKSLGRGTNPLKMFSRKAWAQPSKTPNVPPLPSSEPSTPTFNPKLRAHSRYAKTSVSSVPDLKSLTVPKPAMTRDNLRPSRSRENMNATAAAAADDAAQKPNKASSVATSTNASFSSDVDSERVSRRTSRHSSLSSLRSRASTDNMFLNVPGDKAHPVPSSISSDHSSFLSVGSIRKKDPHWTMFRTIDGEWASFSAKTSPQKSKVVRTILLPFLSKTSDRSIILSLKAEDLDRRIATLNKWWVGLLDLLRGTGQQSVSGTDRPAFFEAICEIMARPEWRSSRQPSPLENAESPVEALFDRNASPDSDEPDYLIKQVHHNIRGIFVHNLIQQLTFVVDKLSMRAAPASLVVFAGKTTAYAFFYCPGVADMLVRLWRIPPGTLRRLFAEYGTEDGKRTGALSRQLAASFPAPLRSLCYTSCVSLSRQLQQKCTPPANTAHIRWHGPWVSRWNGRDSDLFYVFVKNYHLLASEHIDRHLLPSERLAVPGFVVIHAQILINLEASLYRQTGQNTTENYANSDLDAVALPMIVANATRTIGENRIIVLLRDCLGDKKTANPGLAEVLVGPFQFIFRAAVRKISMFNNDACYVLCDFLEELLPLIARYQRFNVEDEYWSFWFSVYKRLMETESTSIQIRFLAFLYAVWPIVVSSEERKVEVVLEWLLSPAFFARFFNHWSPMVRHYYFRLLCWRTSRCDGSPTEIDVQIYRRLSTLLRTSWAHHQYLTADAEMRNSTPPSATPCAPAPGRALLIIRNDHGQKMDSFTTFDKLMPSSGIIHSPYTSHSSALNKLPEADVPQSAPKKRWNLLKSISLFSGPVTNRPGEVTPPDSPDSINSERTAHSGTASRPESPPMPTLYFKFTLEHTAYRPQLPIKGRKLAQPTLPHTSQKVLDDLEKLSRLSSSSSLASNEPLHLKPKPHEMTTARYSGRALSEWALVVQECRNFYLRRKQEGCPRDSAVETPSIAVENFKMFG